MIKNVIFDFGNVITRFYPNELTAACISDENKHKALIDVVFDRAYWERLDAGTITDEEAKAAMCSRLSPELHKDARAIYDNWVKNLLPVDGMPDLVAAVKKRGVKLFLLSNISKKFAKEHVDTPWIKSVFSLFDGLVFSSRLNIIKPDPKIYTHLLETYNLQAEECLFIDDNAANVAAATSLGITAILFEGSASHLMEQLNKYI